MSDPMRWLTVAALLVLPILAGQSHAAATPSEQARALLARGAFDSAMAVVDSALVADSANPDLWMVRSTIHAARSDRTAQTHALRAILERYPLYPDALIALAKVYVDSGLADSAAQYLKPHLLRGGPNLTEVLYLRGRVLESRGQFDSAVTVYRTAYDVRDRRALLRFPPQTQHKINLACLVSAEGISSVWRAGVPTMFLFWADWSPTSVAAFGDVVENLKGAGITWCFVPVNVDSADPGPETIASLVSSARDIGYTDTVWVDRDLTLLRGWDIQRIPTVIVVSINGEIDAVIDGWSPEARRVIVDQYLGSYADSVGEVASASPERTRARHLLASAFQAGHNGNLEQAVKRADLAVTTDSTFPFAYVSLAAWRWLRGDTLGARIAAHQAVAADPNDLWALMAIARVEYLHGQFQSSFDLAHQCLALDSEFVPAWRVLGHSALALGDTLSADLAAGAIARFNKLDLGLPVLRAGLLAATDAPRAAALLREVIAAIL